jgi:signal transduction histidine kinase
VNHLHDSLSAQDAPLTGLQQRVPLGNHLPDPAALAARDERLASMRAMVGKMAHDFNNALAPLTGYVALLGEEIQEGTASREYLARIESSMGRAEKLVTDILQATHPERTFYPKLTDFTALLQGVTEVWRNALPPSAQISVQWDVGPCRVFVDEMLWARAIQELLRNAEGAMTRGGTLVISLRQQLLATEEAAVLGVDSADLILLSFQDNGCGMAPDVLQRACDPLFSTESRRAAGLGLTLVHSLARLQGGQMALDSEEELGTQIRIWLPNRQS